MSALNSFEQTMLWGVHRRGLYQPDLRLLVVARHAAPRQGQRSDAEGLAGHQDRRQCLPADGSCGRCCPSWRCWRWCCSSASMWSSQLAKQWRCFATEDAARFWLGIGRSLAFVVGAAFSILVGQLGMRVAIEGNIRVAAEAVREQL